MSTIRLDRYLADLHLGSRKQIREWLKDGRVRVDGEVQTRPDTRIDTDTARVEYDGETLSYSKYRYLMLNKPAGVVSATRDGLSKTVIDLLQGHSVKGLAPVGRLDKDTEGLLILTDDGALSHHLTSPAHHVKKVYEVHLAHAIEDAQLALLCEGVDIGDEEKTLPAEAERLADDAEGHPVIALTLREGRFHQVKRMIQALGNEVVFLKRVAVDTLTLDKGLKPGAFRNLSAQEIALLKGELSGEQG